MKERKRIYANNKNYPPNIINSIDFSIGNCISLLQIRCACLYRSFSHCVRSAFYRCNRAVDCRWRNPGTNPGACVIWTQPIGGSLGSKFNRRISWYRTAGPHGGSGRQFFVNIKDQWRN